MKVWELIAELSKRPAGENVYIARSESHSYMDITSASHDATDGLLIYGDGTDDESDAEE